MKKVTVIAFALSALILSACSDDDDAPSKSIFAQWTTTDNTFSFDLTGATFNDPFDINFLLGTGEMCSCSAFVIGEEAEGNISVHSCTYDGGGAGDPGCTVWENSGNPYTYTKSGTSLSLCVATSDCENYK